MAISFSWLTAEIRRRLLLGLPLPTVGLGAVLSGLLERPAALREAEDIKGAVEVMSGWSEAGLIDSIHTALYLDFALLALGSTWLALFCLWVADQRSGRLRWAGWIFAGVALLGGAMDALENVALLQLLAGEVTSGWLFAADAGALLKSVALAVTGLFALGGCFVLAVLPSRPPPKRSARLATDPLPDLATPAAQPRPVSAPPMND